MKAVATPMLAFAMVLVVWPWGAIVALVLTVAVVVAGLMRGRRVS